MPPPSPLSTLPSHLRMHMIIAVLQPPWASRRVPAWRRARLRLEGLKGRAAPAAGAPPPPPLCLPGTLYSHGRCLAPRP